MSFFRIVVLISLVTVTAMGQQDPPQEPQVQPELVPPASCPVTKPPAVPFKPPSQYELDENGKAFWLGTEKLWTVLRKSGVWEWAPHPPGPDEYKVQPLTEKTFWMSVDFNWATEWRPKLRVTGRRLDGFATRLRTLPPTNAFPGPSAAMLSGVYVPAPGCWEITGEYHGQKLSYVIWVKPHEQDEQ